MAEVIPASLLPIEVSRIDPNSENPRGPNVRENDPHRENLMESIAEFGILVPLVLREKDGNRYELIDGERRYWIAKSLKIAKVPAFVFTGKLDEKEILRRMFQIHMNRDQWDAVQQCRASEALYKDLLVQFKGDEYAVVAEFARFTGDDRRTARNRIQFLRWPADIKEEIYKDPAKHDSYWYVVEIEDKIIEPAQRNYPEYFVKVDVNDVRRFLYRKWEAKTVSAAVDVRLAAPLVRSEITSKDERARVLKIFNKLVRSTEQTYGEAYEDFARQFPDLVEPKLPKLRSLINTASWLAGVFSRYGPDHIATYTRKDAQLSEELFEAVESLVEAARGFLRRMRTLAST
jgi:ParB/RepB/Spo0J family partition protein